MGRKRGKSRPPAAKAKGGMMRSMRGGFRSAVGKAAGAGDGSSRAGNGRLFWNVLTVVLVMAAALLLASRLGLF